MLRSSLSRGFTRIELVVVIMVLALLITLLLPAIHMRRNGHGLHYYCRNNMRQVGIALTNHVDAYKAFPQLFFRNTDLAIDVTEDNPRIVSDPVKASAPGNIATGGQYSWLVRLLPFMEEDPLYKQMSKNTEKFTLGIDHESSKMTNGKGELVSPQEIELNCLKCPSYSGDFSSSTNTFHKYANNSSGQIAATNYVAIAGTKSELVFGTPDDTFNADGVITARRGRKGITFGEVKDGTSKTIVVTETREGVELPKGISLTPSYPANSWTRPDTACVVGFPPALTSMNVPAYQNDKFTPLKPDVTAIHYGPQQGQSGNQITFYNGTAASDKGPMRAWGPSSDHTGDVVIHVFADDSVIEISMSNIEPKVYYALITRNGGEPNSYDLP